MYIYIIKWKKKKDKKYKKCQEYFIVHPWTTSHSAIYYKTILNEQRETSKKSIKVVPMSPLPR